MSRESTCRCLICALERSLTEQLGERPRQERYQQFADSRSLLSAFPSASDLIAYLHSSRGTSDGVDSTDRILAELLRTMASDGDAAALRDLLLLAFIPMLHGTSRQVVARYSSLSADDIAQHVVASLLQILGSPEFNGRSSHVAFAISRILKRNAFAWAGRECRSPLHDAVETVSDAASGCDTPEPVERAALLRHFLHRCQQRGLLTGEDLQLLVQYKLDAARDREPGGPAAVVSNASRQRMKRLLGKLRRIARAPRSRTQNEVQLRLF
jgi:NAD(P)H-dependent FMN reductase